MVSSPWLVSGQPFTLASGPFLIFCSWAVVLECTWMPPSYAAPCSSRLHFLSSASVYFPLVSTVCLALLQPPAIFPLVYRPNMTLKQLTGYISLQGFKWQPLPFPSSRVTSPRVFPAPPGSHYSCEPLGFPLITYSLLLKSLHYRSLIPTRILEDWEESCPFCISKAYQQFNSVQSLSCIRLFATPWITACQASLSITNSQSSLKLMSIESVMPSSHLILCHPLLLLPPIPPSIRVFSNESTLRMRWPKYWSFTFSISPSNEYPGLISFRMDWLDLLAVHGLSRVFSNTTVQKHQFFGTQLSSQSNSHIHIWLLEKP